MHAVIQPLTQGHPAFAVAEFANDTTLQFQLEAPNVDPVQMITVASDLAQVNPSLKIERRVRTGKDDPYFLCWLFEQTGAIPSKVIVSGLHPLQVKAAAHFIKFQAEAILSMQMQARAQQAAQQIQRVQAQNPGILVPGGARLREVPRQ